MADEIIYDIYHGTNDRTLRLATMPGAGLPPHLKRKDWMLRPTGKSPVHSDTARDVAVQGIATFNLFQVLRILTHDRVT